MYVAITTLSGRAIFHGVAGYDHLTYYLRRREGRIDRVLIFSGKGAPSGAADRERPPFVKH